MESDIHPSDKRIIQFMQLLRLYSFLTWCNWSHTDIADISLYSFPNIVSSFRRRLNDWNLVSLQNMQCYNSVQVSNENLSGPNVTRQGNRESATRYAKPVRCMLDFYTAVCEMATVNDTHCLLMYMSVLWSPCFHLSLLQTYPPFSMMIPDPYYAERAGRSCLKWRRTIIFLFSAGFALDHSSLSSWL